MNAMSCPANWIGLILLASSIFAQESESPAFASTIASNTPPLNKKLVAALRSSLILIDRTQPTLINGSAALGVPELLDGGVQIIRRIQVMLKQKLYSAFPRLSSSSHN